METLLIVLVAAAFIALLGVNIYFRVRVFSAYKHLVRSGVKFESRDILSSGSVERIVAHYPEHERQIRTFTRGIRRSVSIASLLIVLISLLAAVLMWNR